MNTVPYFLLYQSCRSLRDVSFGGRNIPFLSLIETSYRDRRIMMTSSESHLFSFASAPQPHVDRSIHFSNKATT